MKNTVITLLVVAVLALTYWYFFVRKKLRVVDAGNGIFKAIYGRSFIEFNPATGHLGSFNGLQEKNVDGDLFITMKVGHPVVIITVDQLPDKQWKYDTSKKEFV